MMQQYFGIKKDYPDTIVLFRMGDFYEAFFEDACEVSKILNITLTHRGKVGGFSIPMAGIPHHAAGSYIDRITESGRKAAMAEQTEDPKDAVGIVERAVAQVVSPGIPYDLDRADSRQRQFISSSFIAEDGFFITAIDFTTGDFVGMVTEEKDDFLEKIRLLCPKEIITYRGQFDGLPEMDVLLKHGQILPTYLGEDYFDPKVSSIYTERLIPGLNRDETLARYPSLLCPLGAMAYYVCTAQKQSNFCHIRPFKIADESGIMRVSLSALEGLGILPRLGESYKKSLLGFLDRTTSPLGPRRLRELLTAPLDDQEAILERQELMAFFCEHPDKLFSIRERLSGVRDLERITAKVSKRKAHGGDILALSESIKIYFQILKDFEEMPRAVLLPFTKGEMSALRGLYREIVRAVNHTPGASLEKGNLIKEGYHAERDRLAKFMNNFTERLSELEERYRAETGISKLKLKSNSVSGHFIEVGKSFINKIPSSFQRRQTLVGAERYTTEELLRFEHDIATAKDNLEALERELFDSLLKKIFPLTPAISKTATDLGLMDAFSALAHTALGEKFTRPSFSSSKKIKLTGSWHPLIKESLQEKFVPHDLTLDDKQFFGLITGPNMAGKTTVMRETAIIQVLAQIGSFVPAEKAELGLCDRLFSRLGAFDDILKGQSTFMVEMSETAEIIRHASGRSLVILDEVGRGTSTYDGLSIAWALVEYFIEHTKAFVLFATHYHELVDLVDSKDSAKNLTVETEEVGGRVKFLYRLVDGAAGRSFGIHVAEMAGLPREILDRASCLLRDLESGRGHSSPPPQAPAESPRHLRILEDRLKEIDPLKITPMEALNKVQELKSHCEANEHPS